MTKLLLFERRSRSPNKGSFSFYYTREIYTSYYEKKGCVDMLYMCFIMMFVYVGLTVLGKLNDEEELRQAEVEGYEITFID